LNFIATLMSEEEAVGDVTSLATSNITALKKRKTVSLPDSDEEETEEGTLGTKKTRNDEDSDE